MADFCAQCAKEIGFDGSDFLYVKDHLTPEDEAQGMGVLVLCEGCGPILVDRKGACISQDCGRHGHIEKEFKA